MEEGKSGGPKSPIPGEIDIPTTSALPYVNNVPHLRNIIGCVLRADVYARYCRLGGYNALIYICGSLEENCSPKEICDNFHAIHKEVYDRFDISFDKFGRTSTPQHKQHKQVSQVIFNRLWRNSPLLVKTMHQLYCNTCKKSVTCLEFQRCIYGSVILPRCEVCRKTPRPDLQIIELPVLEDSAPFYNVMFPSDQLGTGENWTLTKTISATEYLNYEGEMYSKSKGVGVFGFDVKDTNIPVEVWRYYLLTNQHEVSDKSFEWEDLQAKLNDELVSNLGNFVYRVLSFIAMPESAGYGSVIPDAPFDAYHVPSILLGEKVGRLVAEYVKAMENLNLKQGLNTAMLISGQGNIYLRENKTCCAIVIRTVAGLVHILAQLLEPFMPSFSREVLKQLNFPPHFPLGRRKLLQQASSPWEILPHSHKIGTPEPLFKELKDEEVQRYKEKFGNLAEDEEATRPAPRPAMDAVA